MSTFRGQVGRLKSRTGCKTCKIRRVKCGEEKPHCLRCTSTGRRCDYESPYSVPRVLSTLSLETKERRAFEYYYFHAAPSLSDALDLDFWRGTVLQICRSQPAVWDAIVALSTLYEHPPPIEGLPTYQIEDTDRLPSPRSESHREALTWYSRSINRVQRQIQRGVADYTVAIVSCVLFICIEMLQGNVKAALMLSQHGAQLMAMAKSESLSQLKTILLRVETFAVILNGVNPEPERPPSSHTVVDAYASLSDARTAFNTLVADWKVFDCDSVVSRSAPADLSPDTLRLLQYRQTALEGSLLAWHRRFRAMHITDHQGIIATLSMTYRSILILTRTGLSTTESRYDAHEADFTEIITSAPAALAATVTDNGHQPPFTFDMGTRMALIITILKCRSPGIRRQALRFLRQGPPLQGVYLSYFACDFLAAVVAIEEDGPRCSEEELSVSSLLARPGRVPMEHERIFYMHLVPWRAGTGDMRTALKYSRRETVDGEVRVLNEVVVLPARAPHKPLTIL
ncbi:hypothetical protein BDW59DRAFT_87890 [Aspergillus cavernicola]|uniref:Zn(2)-C6 fungal-type domain-containing protein n=1 Tax=Aspergillus cavernicola TaxID=176166 RepID=A0ABR4I996_9EURO